MRTSSCSATDRHEDRLRGERGERTGLARIPTQGEQTVRCRRCSTPAPEQLVRIAGAWSVIDGVALWDCDSCARARVHEFEAEGQQRHRVPTNA